MKRIGILLGIVMAMAFVAAPAKADTMIVFSGTGASCGGSDCFGNVLTLVAHPTGGNNYEVTLSVDTSGNTNVGSAIAGITFDFGGMTSANLTSAPGGTAGWTVTLATLSANGCASGNQSPACTFDAAFLNTLNSMTPTTGLAALPNNGTYEWMFTVTAPDPISDINFRVLFGTMDASTQTLTQNACPAGYTFSSGTCRKTTIVGQASQGSCAAFPGTTKVGNNCVTVTTTAPSCAAGYTLQTQGSSAGQCTKTVTEYTYKQTGLISASGTGTDTHVPEPGTVALLSCGLLGLAGFRRRNK